MKVLGQHPRGARGTIHCAKGCQVPRCGGNKRDPTLPTESRPVVLLTQAQGRAGHPPGDHPVLHDGQGSNMFLPMRKPLTSSSSRLWHLISTRDAIPAQHGPDLTDSKQRWAEEWWEKPRKPESCPQTPCLAPHPPCLSSEPGRREAWMTKFFEGMCKVGPWERMTGLVISPCGTC